MQTSVERLQDSRRRKIEKLWQRVREEIVNDRGKKDDRLRE